MGDARPHLTDAERRRRLVTRQHLGATAPSVEAATADLVVLHASDPVTPYLAARARVAGVDVGDVERALYETRSLWRGHAMRRTLFVATVEDIAVLDAGAGRLVAAKERRRLEGWLAASLGDEATPASWLETARQEVLTAIAERGPMRTTELTEAVPRLAHRIVVGSGRWAQEAPISTRLLYLMAMELDLVRGRPAGTWRGSQFRWADTRRWFADHRSVPDPIVDPATGRAALARRYLERFGPVTALDLKWWAGWTVAQTTAALRDVRAVEVALDRDGTGWVLPGDAEPTPVATAPTVALLPGLDPTPMGWKERDWYLDPDHVAQLFDRNGNVGPTIWVDGRAVGAWAVRADGGVVTSVLTDISSEAIAQLEERVVRLTAWLDGTPVSPRFPTPLERRLRTSAPDAV